MQMEKQCSPRGFDPNSGFISLQLEIEQELAAELQSCFHSGWRTQEQQFVLFSCDEAAA